VRVFPEVLQNNATQKDDTLRAHQARGKSMRVTVAPTAKRARGNARRSATRPRGGRACSMLSLPRRTADPLPWSLQSAAATKSILIASTLYCYHYHVNDDNLHDDDDGNDLRKGQRRRSRRHAPGHPLGYCG